MGTPSGRWVIGYPKFVIFNPSRKWTKEDFYQALESHDASTTYDYYYTTTIDDDPPTIPRAFWTWGFCFPKGRNPTRVDIKENFANKYINLPFVDREVVINLGQARTDIILNAVFTNEKHYQWFRSVMQSQYDFKGRNAMTTKEPDVIPMLLFPGTSAEYRVVYVDNWKTIRDGERGGVWEVQVTLVDLEPHQWFSDTKTQTFYENQLLNGRFEGNNPLRGWTIYTSAAPNVMTASGERFEGQYALLVERPSSGASTGGGYAIYETPIDLTINSTYIIGCYFKTVGGRGVVDLLYPSGGKSLIFTNVATWTLTIKTFVASQTPAVLRVGAATDGAAKMFLDNIFLIDANNLHCIDIVELTNSGAVYTFPRNIKVEGKANSVLENYQDDDTNRATAPTSIDEAVKLTISSQKEKLISLDFKLDWNFYGTTNIGTAAKITLTLHDASDNVLFSANYNISTGINTFTIPQVVPDTFHVHITNKTGEHIFVWEGVPGIIDPSVFRKYELAGTQVASHNNLFVTAGGIDWSDASHAVWVVDGRSTTKLYKYLPSAQTGGDYVTAITLSGAGSELGYARGLVKTDTGFWVSVSSGTVYANQVLKLDTNGTILINFTAPGNLQLESLTFDGTYLYGCNIATIAIVYKFEQAGTVVSSFTAPKTLYGLKYYNGYLWGISRDGIVYKLDSAGTVLLSFTAGGSYNNALTIGDDIVVKSKTNNSFQTAWYRQYSMESTRNFQIFNINEPSNVLMFGRELTEQSQPHWDRSFTSCWSAAGGATLPLTAMIAQKIKLEQGNVTKMKFVARKTGTPTGYKLLLYPETSATLASCVFVGADANFTGATAFKSAAGTAVVGPGYFAATASDVYFRFKKPVPVGTGTVSYYAVIVPIATAASGANYVEWFYLASGALYSGGNFYQPESRLWVVDYYNRKVFKLDNWGTTLLIFSTPEGTTQPRQPTIKDGYIWLMDDTTRKIYKLDKNGTVLIEFSSPTGVYRTAGFVWDGNAFWTCDWGLNKIIKFDINGTTLLTFSSPGGTIPYGITWDGSNIWVADIDVDKIYKLDANGTVLLEFSFPTGEGNLRGLGWDGSNLWMYGQNTRKFYKLDANGTVLLEFSSTLKGAIEQGPVFEIHNGPDAEPSACLAYTVYYEDPVSVRIPKDSFIQVLPDGHGIAEWILVASGDDTINIEAPFDVTGVTYTSGRWEFNQASGTIKWRLESPFPMKNLRIIEIKAKVATAVDGLKFYWAKEAATDTLTWNLFKTFITSGTEFDLTSDFKFGSASDNETVVYLAAVCSTGAVNNYIKRLKVRAELDTSEYSPLEIQVGTAEFVTSFDPVSSQKARVEITYRERR